MCERKFMSKPWFKQVLGIKKNAKSKNFSESLWQEGKSVNA